MTRAIVYDRCIDVARATAVRLRRSRIVAAAIHPTDFDLTFESGGLPHVIITELEMPLFSGFELIRQVRSEWGRSELPIIAYTSVDDALAWAAAKEAGANEVVTKCGPDPLKRLESAVARCLGRNDAPPPSAAINVSALRHPAAWARWFVRGGSPAAVAA